MSPRLRAMRRLMRSVNRWIADRREMDIDGAVALLPRIVEQAAIIHGEGLGPPTQAQQEGLLESSLALVDHPRRGLPSCRC